MAGGVRTVALIGSFRQDYARVQQVWRQLTDCGVEVTSPRGSSILEEGIPFVRFHTDPERWDDPTVQMVALHRIMRADLTYVVVSDGYVGRTTCFEIGRVSQAGRPLYFSEVPLDLPLAIPEENVLTPEELLTRLASDEFTPQPFDATSSGWCERLGQALVLGRFLDEDALAGEAS